MFSRIKKSFSIVNNNLILSQPFVLYLLILTMAMGAVASRTNLTAFLILSLSMVLLSVAFLAGWFYMTKKVIEYEKTTLLEGDEKKIASIGLFKEFFPGVGEYFLPILGSLILYFSVLFLFFWGVYEIGVFAIGEPNFDYACLNAAAKTYLSMKTYIATLPHATIINILKWILYVSFFSITFQFVTLWWCVPLYFNSKNPFKALAFAAKFLFNHFVPSLGIFIFLTVFNIVVSTINSLAGNNIIFLFLSFILFFYYVTYYVVLIFLYYGEENGYYSNSGPHSYGQEQLVDRAGEEA